VQGRLKGEKSGQRKKLERMSRACMKGAVRSEPVLERGRVIEGGEEVGSLRETDSTKERLRKNEKRDNFDVERWCCQEGETQNSQCNRLKRKRNPVGGKKKRGKIPLW